MVAVQRQEQAQAEAAQRQTLADADFYVAQKEADANAYRLTQNAQAEARRIALAAEAQQQAVRALLAEMRGQGDLAEKYLDYLIAQELKENSKWVIGGGESLSILDLGGE
jgi:flotillin